MKKKKNFSSLINFAKFGLEIKNFYSELCVRRHNKIHQQAGCSSHKNAKNFIVTGATV